MNHRDTEKKRDQGSGKTAPGVFRGIRDRKAQEAVLVDFAPVKGSRIGELAAKFDIVLGITPED
jgi:protocatechuate 3,4-dioxygenase beta subunit